MCIHGVLDAMGAPGVCGIALCPSGTDLLCLSSEFMSLGGTVHGPCWLMCSDPGYRYGGRPQPITFTLHHLTWDFSDSFYSGIL